MVSWKKSAGIFCLLCFTTTLATLCRDDCLDPHQQSLWQEGFPVGDTPLGLCDGTISVASDGSVCVSGGRVNWAQLGAAMGKPIFAPASDTISLTGHLISGTGNVVLGTQAAFLYDFVTSFTVDGVSYTASTTMADTLLAASRGTVDGVCFSSAIAADISWYKMSRKFYLPSLVDMDEITNANIIYAGFFSVVAEYHTAADEPYLITGHLLLGLINFAAGIFPSFTFQVVPFLGFTGVFRLFAPGTMSTEKYPQPLSAPDITVENVMINTEWSTLMSAMSAGLFTDDMVKLYFGVVIKKITPTSSNSCWTVTVAAIDIQAPQTSGDKLDTYIAEVVYPALATYGTMDLHMGKRIDGGSSIMSAALSSYNTKCGVELALTPTNCYHPACKRNNAVDSFTYPSAFYQ